MISCKGKGPGKSGQVGGPATFQNPGLCWSVQSFHRCQVLWSENGRQRPGCVCGGVRDRLSPFTYPSVQYSQSCVKGMRPEDPGVLMPSSEHSGQDLGATSLGQPMPQQHRLKVPTPSQRVCMSPPQDQAETHIEGTAGSGPHTFLHLLAGRGSSSVSDEVEELSSFSVPVRKWALGKGMQVRHSCGTG